MLKLDIVNIDNYLYNLKDEENNNYKLNLDFFDIKEKLKIGDCIYISEELLDPKFEGYSTSYTFGSLDSKYGKSNIEIRDIDVIKIETDHKEIYLKRLYG